MASDKANYVVNYFTFDISDIVNQTQCANQNLPICQYQVFTDAQNGIEIVSNEIIENSTIDKEHNGRINIIEGVMIASSPQEPEFSTNECELSEIGDATDDNEENDNDNNNDNDDDNDDEEEEDDLADLTNLNWLTELKNITNLPPAAQEVPEKRSDPPSQRFDKFINQVNKMRENYDKRRDLYETVVNEKPPFNYAQIIGMALIEEGRLTLKQICDWIERKFAYYKTHKNWNVSFFLVLLHFDSLHISKVFSMNHSLKLTYFLECNMNLIQFIEAI
jgi:Forkhead domain